MLNHFDNLKNVYNSELKIAHINYHFCSFECILSLASLKALKNIENQQRFYRMVLMTFDASQCIMNRSTRLTSIIDVLDSSAATPSMIFVCIFCRYIIRMCCVIYFYILQTSQIQQIAKFSSELTNTVSFEIIFSDIISLTVKMDNPRITNNLNQF